MKIQVTTQYFYPDNFIINSIVKELVHMGHEVHVLTGQPDYATGNVPQAYRRFRKRREELFGAQVRRCAVFARRHGVVCRALNYFTYMINSSAVALFSKKNSCDCIFVYETSPIFQALPGIVYKKKTGKKLVLYCCDLWPESLKAWNIKEDSILFGIVKRFSSWLYRQCDIVLITSKPFRDYLIGVCGVQEERIVYLPQFAEDIFHEIACQYEDNGVFDFLFAGNIGSVQGVDGILRAVKLIETDKPFRVHIIGDGSELQKLKALCEELSLEDRVVFHGRHPVEAMPGFYRMADSFLLTLSSDSFIGMTLPSKTQGYMSAGKAVVAAIGGAAAEVLEDAGCGLVSQPGDFEALAKNMQRIIEGQVNIRQLGERAREYYLKNFTKNIFMDKLIGIFQE